MHHDLFWYCLKLDALTKRARYQYGVKFTIQIPPLSSILLILCESWNGFDN